MPAVGQCRFVVHKHHATADHYDLRLELGGVLKCWAVPKGPSPDPAEKRFAVETEDHPVDYLDFEGVIPAGEYGGGPMIVWDRGTWAPMGDAGVDLAAGTFKFRLWGEKLRGGWMLVRLKQRRGEAQPGWLLIKELDPSAVPGGDILFERPESVKSGRRIEELALTPKARPSRSRPDRMKGAVKAPPDPRISLQLASPAAKPPEGPGWLHEIKLDGYRTLARLGPGDVRLITRGGLDWTDRYGDLPQAFDALPCREAVIDGEIVAVDEHGISRFAILQQALSEGPGGRLTFFAFDLLRLDGWDLRAGALADRKALLARLLAGLPANHGVQFCDHVEGGGAAFYERVSEMGLEGVVSKRRERPYQAGRGPGWTKTKAVQFGDFAVVGYTVSEAAGGLAALALAEPQEEDFRYVGKVGTGFDRETAESLLARLEPLRDDAARPEGMPKDVRSVRPLLTAHVHYAARTSSGALRHAVFRGLREVAFKTARTPARRRLVSDADLASIWVTNPTRRLFGRTGPTKLDVAVYYAQIGDFMLPHLLHRPVSLVRCPTGRPQDCFFQRHPFTGMPASMASFEARTSDGEARQYLSVEDVRGYLALAQFGVIEFHTWGTTRKRMEQADRVTFDLDPGEGVPWREVVEAAVHIRGALVALGLVPFVKTTGGKGLHVTVPIRPKLGWDRVHAATGAIAEQLAAGAPDVFVTTMAKSRRARRIFIDFHRNARHATAVAPYSLRARANLPVATPVDWADLEKVDAPADLNYSVVPGLVASSGDPWAEIDSFARDLPETAKPGR